MTRGEYITELRKDKNYTQDYVADKLGVDRSTISKYEHDASEMNLEIMEQLALIYEDKLINIIYGDKDAYKNIENDIEKLHYEKHQSELKNIKLKKKLSFQILLTIITISFFTILFFVYYFINTYNSIKVYRIEPEHKNIISFENANLIITSQKILLNIANIITNKDINKIELYKNNLIISTRLNSKNIMITDNIESQSYFDFKNINKEINNLYLKIYTNDETITTKLILKNIYNNIDLLFSNKTKTILNNDYYKANIIIDNQNYRYNKANTNEINFFNDYNGDVWTLIINKDILSYRNNNFDSFQYNLKTKEYIYGKPNDKKLNLFYKLYEQYKTIEEIQ